MTGPLESPEVRVLTRTGTTASGARCWSTIGVWGSDRPRCALLDGVQHCRNCAVFKAAGRELLERDVPEAPGAEWSEGLAAQHADERVARAGVLIVRLGPELMAFPLETVVEIAEWRPVHSLPHRRDAALIGVANVGGDLRLCVSLERLFGSEPAPLPGPDGRGRLVAIGAGALEWLVPVHETLSVHMVALDTLEPAPATVGRSAAAFVRGIFTWRGRQVALLDADLVLGALRRRLT